MSRASGSRKGRKTKRANSGGDCDEERVESAGQYYAEAILDWGLYDNGVCMYLVQWEHYSAEHNSWEFEPHVSDCDQLMDHFRANTVNGRHAPKHSWKEFDNFCRYLREVCDERYADVAVLAKLSKHGADQLVRRPELIERIKADIESECDLLVNEFEDNRDNDMRLEAQHLLNRAAKRLNIDCNFESLRQLFEFIDLRKTIKGQLNGLANEWNAIIRENNGSLVVSLVNDVDIETPKHFDYITKCKYSFDDIEMIDEPLVGCECTDCYADRDQCCCSVVGFPMAYDRNGLLSASRFAYISFECNSLCECGQKCANRATQRPTNWRLQVFRTDNGERGWGLRTADAIPRGAFVCEFVGEILTVDEAAKRDNTYLFDLGAHLSTKDENDTKYTYFLDAGKWGNVSRFVNHSCEPNCRAVLVWSNNYDKHVPRVALFAVKRIGALQELTFDYGMQVIDLSDDRSTDRGVKEITRSDQKSANLVHSHSKTVASKQKREMSGTSLAKIECRCGSANCRQILYV